MVAGSALKPFLLVPLSVSLVTPVYGVLGGSLGGVTPRAT